MWEKSNKTSPAKQVEQVSSAREVREKHRVTHRITFSSVVLSAENRYDLLET